MKRFLLSSVLGMVLGMAAGGCTPNVQRFERFELSAGQVDVLWLFIDDQLNRCIATPKGPVCVRASYLKSDAERADLASIPPTPPAVASVPAPSRM